MVAEEHTAGAVVQGRASNVNLNHNPDKPLAANVPFLKITQDECFHIVKKNQPGEAPLNHTNWWTKPDNNGGHATSKTVITVRLTIQNSNEVMAVPVETGATCGELANVLGYKTGIEPSDIVFVSKQGCSWRRMYVSDQVRPNMTVRGITSFKKVPVKYKHPKAIIGAGHIGLKTAMIFLKKNDPDFIVIDRMSRVGGTSWMYQANTTSKLQTEYGAYHLEYDEDNPIPTMFNSPWPSRNKLLEHFQSVCEDYGVLPYVRLNTNVKEMEMYDSTESKVKNFSAQKWSAVENYRLTLERIDIGELHHGKFAPKADREHEDTFLDSCGIMLYPGNLTLPREETYKGEELFDGQIGYGMFDEVDYSMVPGKDICIVGHGAFAVENVRTCCEYGANKCFILCRRKNISCPRVVSWMANRSLVPLTCGEFLDFMKPMYGLIGWDPWTYYAVNTNANRTSCMITQKARFGIGDIYFLSIYMGKLEVIIDQKGIKRVHKNSVILESGRRLENIEVILKLLGFVGEMDNDRLMKIKEMVGFWVNEDPRRYLVAEPVSVMASNMGGTSLSAGALNWAVQAAYFFHFPQDLVNGCIAMGMLPRHAADLSDESTPRPAYVVDARHGTSTGMSVSIHTPHLAQEQSFEGVIKAVKQRLCHPAAKFIQAAKEDWDYYAEKFLKEGFGTDKPYPSYPFTYDSAKEMILLHMKQTNEPPLPSDYEDLKL